MLYYSCRRPSRKWPYGTASEAAFFCEGWEDQKLRKSNCNCYSDIGSRVLFSVGRSKIAKEQLQRYLMILAQLHNQEWEDQKLRKSNCNVSILVALPLHAWWEDQKLRKSNCNAMLQEDFLQSQQVGRSKIAKEQLQPRRLLPLGCGCHVGRSKIAKEQLQPGQRTSVRDRAPSGKIKNCERAIATCQSSRRQIGTTNVGRSKIAKEQLQLTGTIS